MRQVESRQQKWEQMALAVLFLLFMLGSYHFETIAQQVDTTNQPSTLATTHPGAGAVYALLGSLGYSVERLTSSWNQIDDAAGVLVVLEPLSRNPTEAENRPLRAWIEHGGTLLFVCTGQPQAEDPHDSIAGDIRLASAAALRVEAEPYDTSSPYTAGVSSIAVSSPLRIVPSHSARYDVLFQDAQGIVAVHKVLGSGHVIVMTNDLIATNTGIAQDDNSIFLVNVARAGANGIKSRILFDEYHHGVGFQSDDGDSASGLWRHTPATLKWVIIDLLAFGAILVYVGNIRRAPLKVARPPQVRASGDYVDSMARIYQRAGAKDLAIQTIYHRLLRDLRGQMHSKADIAPREITHLFTTSFATDGRELAAIVDRCEKVIAGMSISEKELVTLAANIDGLRREFGIVGYQ